MKPAENKEIDCSCCKSKTMHMDLGEELGQCQYKCFNCGEYNVLKETVILENQLLVE